MATAAKRIDTVAGLLKLLQPCGNKTGAVVIANPGQMRVIVCYDRGGNHSGSFANRYFDLSDEVYRESLNKELIQNNHLIRGIDEHLQFTLSEEGSRFLSERSK